MGMRMGMDVRKQNIGKSVENKGALRGTGWGGVGWEGKGRERKGENESLTITNQSNRINLSQKKKKKNISKSQAPSLSPSQTPIPISIFPFPSSFASFATHSTRLSLPSSSKKSHLFLPPSLSFLLRLSRFCFCLSSTIRE